MVDVVLLAGGRSSRMGVPKPTLLRDGRPLLTQTVKELLGLVGGRVVVVAGPDVEPLVPASPRVTRTSEEPAFGGPVAGIAAGLAVLGGDDDVILLACDLVHAGAVTRALSTVAPADVHAEAVAVPGDRGPEWLSARYRRASLEEALAAAPRLRDIGVKRVLGGLHAHLLDVDPALARDVDAPDELAEFGLELPGVAARQEA